MGESANIWRLNEIHDRQYQQGKTKAEAPLPNCFRPEEAQRRTEDGYDEKEIEIRTNLRQKKRYAAKKQR